MPAARAGLLSAFGWVSAHKLEGLIAGLLGDARGAELEACHRLLDVLERRAAVLELLTDALDPRRVI